MTQPSPTYLLIEERLGEPLAEFVNARRPHTSWRRLALEIFQRTHTDVSNESLRLWFGHDEPERGAA